MSEASGEKREKEETFSEHQETGWSKAKKWLEGDDTWGTRSEIKGGTEKKKMEKRGVEKGEGKKRRGSPTKAELLGKERRESSTGCSSVASSLWSKRGKESDTDSDKEEEEKKRQGAKRAKEEETDDIVKQEEKPRTDRREANMMEEMEKMMKRLLKEQREDLIKELRKELKEEIKREVKEEVKKEVGKYRTDEQNAKGKLEIKKRCT